MTSPKSDDARLSSYEIAREENRRNAACVVFLTILFVAAVVALAGCSSPVIPHAIDAREASFDGNAQNSGVITSTPSGFVVTDHFRARHNALIAVYGGDFSPTLKPDHEIYPIGEDRWLISKQGMVDFLEMNAWRRAGLEPKNK